MSVLSPPAAIGSLLLLALLTPRGFGEAERPTIISNSQTLGVTIDGEPYANGIWNLSPEFDPDLLLIRSKLPYGSKHITFSSEVDAISFDVQAGNDYDFVVMLNGVTPCHIRIAALADPVFWSYRALIPVGIISGVLALFLAARWRQTEARHLLMMGIAAPLLFWGTTIALGAMLPDYSHLGNTISELGTIRSETEAFASTAFLSLSFLCLLFSAGLYKACRASRLSTVPVWLTLCMPISMSWAALFPLGNELHGVLGPLPLLINLGSLLAFLLWRNREGHRAVARLSLASFLVMMMLFLIFFEPINQPYAGLVQRFWYAGWSIWFVGLSVYFLKTMPSDEAAPDSSA